MSTSPNCDQPSQQSSRRSRQLTSGCNLCESGSILSSNRADNATASSEKVSAELAQVMRRSRRPATLAVAITILVLGNIAQRHVNFVACQCPNNTMTSFERIGGVTIKESIMVQLYTAPNSSMFGNYYGGGQHQLFGGAAADLTRQLGAGSSKVSPVIPITAECNNRCRRSAKCRAFLVDYARHTCYAIEQQGHSPQDMLARGPTPVQLISTHERTAYFEKVCLNIPQNEPCEKAWIFERVINYQLLGHDDKIIEEVPSRLKCQEHCLHERDFRCRSGEYDHITMQCRLSMIDRHIRPNAFRSAPSSVDYFENQCAPVGNQCEAFDRFEDFDLGRAEIMRPANTSDQCQQLCTQLIKAFICRSFTWNPRSGRCYLNSANTFTVGGIDKLIPAPGLVYHQRNDCIDLKLECDTNAMTLNLRTNEPFRGRMYVRDDPNSCETLGRSALSSSLNIPFWPMGRCAQRELPSRYSSVVVVQQHPLIQRKSDRYIKLVCDFQTSNRTITSTYNVNANAWTSTALINSTSFAPKIGLRITDKAGQDIVGAKLGDELYLRIEAQTESVYDMVARSVLAKSGNTDESIVLIDKDGCPTDSRIFPPLKKLNKRTILGKFDAFKFSSDVVVRFQVDVQFCLNQCPMTSCDQSLQLFNTNPSQLAPPAPEIYTPGAPTTLSPLPSTSTQDYLLQAASTTQSSVPILQRQQQQQQQQQQQVKAPNELQAASSYLSNHHQLPHHLMHSTPNQMYGRHPSMPANQPQSMSSNGNSNVYNGSSSNSIIDSLNGNSAGDSQTFDGAQPRSVHTSSSSSAKQYGSDELRVRSNQQAGGLPIATITNAIDTPTNIGDIADLANSNGHQAPASSQRRRRRSAEPMPSTPRHVPLQREIIVESAPAQKASAGESQATKARKKQRDARKQDGQMNRDEIDDGNKATDQTARREQQVAAQDNNGTLLCTTRHSLVLASLAFCAVQLLTVSLCLITWIHKKDTKFKVKHPIEERLY